VKISTNIRAGKGQNRNGKSSVDDNPGPESVEVEVYVPPVSRCTGI